FGSNKKSRRESSRLSLSTAGSSTNAAFGAVSAGGDGTPESDPIQSGDGPCAFVASQPSGNAGGSTASKFSLSLNCCWQRGHGNGVGVGPIGKDLSTETSRSETADSA